MSTITPEGSPIAKEMQEMDGYDADKAIAQYPDAYPAFVLWSLREFGPGSGQVVYDGVKAADGLDKEGWRKASRLHVLMVHMAMKGTLWMHQVDDEIAFFGISGEQDKEEFLDDQREAAPFLFTNENDKS